MLIQKPYYHKIVIYAKYKNLLLDHGVLEICHVTPVEQSVTLIYEVASPVEGFDDTGACQTLLQMAV